MHNSSIYLFGSHSRNDYNENSDLDLLVVCPTKDQEKVDEDFLLSIKNEYSKEPSFSFYSQNRLREMYEGGHLFAWHLYNEARFLDGEDYLKQLGQPAAYSSFDEDIEPLLDLFNSIESSVNSSPGNLIYEAGILFVCLRNIALSLSWFYGELDFSKESPLNLNPVHSSLDKEIYQKLIKCRYASTRGLESPNICIEELRHFYRQSKGWVRSQIMNVKNIKERVS